MAIAKAPKRSTAPGVIDEQEKERRAEAFISGGGSNPAPQPTPTKHRKTPVTMKWDPSLLERIDQAAERKGINRTAWVHFKLSEALDQEER